MHPSARRPVTPAPAAVAVVPVADPAVPPPVVDANGARSERRREARLSIEALGLDAEARLGPAIPVRVINVSPGGALVEQQDWVRPGTPTELQLTRHGIGGQPERLVATGTIARSVVHGVAPLVYRSAILFDQPKPRSAKVTTTVAPANEVAAKTA